MRMLSLILFECAATLKRMYYTFKKKAFICRCMGFYYELAPGDLINQHTYAYGAFERPMIEYLRDNIFHRCPWFSEGVFLDIGSNIGTYSLTFHSLFSRVIAFEPSEEAYKRSLKNVKLNGISNIDVRQAALSDSCEPRIFRQYVSGNVGASGFVSDISELAGSDLKELAPSLGDEFIIRNNISHVAFLKIDVEGHEAHVINGLRDTIKKWSPIILFEWDGKRVRNIDFSLIRGALSNYIFYEICNTENPDRFFKRLSRIIKTAGSSFAVPLQLEEGKFYPGILAVPEIRLPLGEL
jgi:FkbM family methyltransferase